MPLGLFPTLHPHPIPHSTSVISGFPFQQGCSSLLKEEGGLGGQASGASHTDGLQPPHACPQVDTSSLSGDNTLMSTLEEKETDGEQGPTVSPAPAEEPCSPLLSPGCTSASSAAKLLSPCQTAPRPRLGGRGRPGRAGASKEEAGPSAHPRTLEGLRLPPVPWIVPPELSPR